MKSFVYWAAACTVAFAPSYAFSQDHSFSVQDDIAMVRFSDPRPDPEQNIPGSEIARQSPDGKHIAVVTTKGLIAPDLIESAISVFDVEKISTFLKSGSAQTPITRIVARIVSFPHRGQSEAYAPTIQDLHWSLDGKSIYFKGEDPQGAYELFQARINGSGLQALTGPGSSVGRFDVVKGAIVYTASKAGTSRTEQGDIINADAQRLTGHPLADVLLHGEMSAHTPETFTLWVLHDHHGRWATSHVPQFAFREVSYLDRYYPFSVSPGGDKLIALTPVPDVPFSWKDYEPAAGAERLRLTAENQSNTVDNLLRPERYSLIDLATGRSTPLFDAPNAKVLIYTDQNRIAWATDESRVLVTNTFLPLTRTTGSIKTDNTLPCAVASVDLPSLHTRCFDFEAKNQNSAETHVLDTSFGKDDDDASVLLRQGAKREIIRRYHLDDGEWRLIRTDIVAAVRERLQDIEMPDKAEKETLRVSIRQGYNDPPQLWAADNKTGDARLLWDPNPQFAHIKFGEASEYTWKDSTGRNWNGLLVKPVGYVSGKTYPLVLQMYTFFEGEFITDGLCPSAFAARHLASAGFVVLQIKKKPSKFLDTDAQEHLEGYRSAIDSLDHAGLIDPSRVGVVGFSWTCWYAINALIKEPKLFAAATVSDGLDNSYMQYILTAEKGNDLQRQMDVIRGESPFGAGLRRWVADAPGFNLDKVQTPIRIEANGPVSALQEWELYASLYSQHKPVDLIYFPQGTHIHQKPLERLESQQGNVDWLRFWLQGYQDPDPAKRAQYKLWQRLKTGDSSIQ